MGALHDLARRVRTGYGRLRGRDRQEVLTFCDRCGELCDRACRADAARADAQRLLAKPF